MEELEFSVSEYRPFVACTFDLCFEGRRTRKIFFQRRDDGAKAVSPVVIGGKILILFSGTVRMMKTGVNL
jgi:hypothetical protein